MDNPIPSRLLSDTTYYSAHFMDLAVWEPSVRWLCTQHGMGCRRVYPGLPGTYPTFIVDLDAGGGHAGSSSIVVKFFGSLFEGAASFAVERAMGRYLSFTSLPVHSPAILAEGELTPGWQYLIFEGIPGVSISQVRQQLSHDSWVHVAGQMGEFMKQLHTTTATTRPPIPMPTEALGWDGFIDFLALQRVKCQTSHLGWNDLPAQLVEQVTDYLLPVQELVDFTSQPHLIHADLTADHLLGRLAQDWKTPPLSTQSPLAIGANWDSLAIIDWGDARIGNILYELVAIYLDLFHADKHLLHICMEQYGLSDFYRQDFPRKALCMLLMHQFPMHPSVYAPFQDAQTLHEIAEALFGL